MFKLDYKNPLKPIEITGDIFLNNMKRKFK